MNHRCAHWFRRAALVLLTVAVGGCGDDGSGPPATSVPQAQERAAEPAARERPAADEDTPAPSRAANAADVRYDALVREYAPVSDRVNYLVAAETLRADAVGAGAGEDIERERFGAVRIEVERMHEVLRAARPRVAAVTVNDARQQHVQDLMLSAIDARMRALRELKVALDAVSSDEVPDTDADALLDAWQASWNLSLRYAREATTAMQHARAVLGLEPALEESIR